MTASQDESQHGSISRRKLIVAAGLGTVAFVASPATAAQDDVATQADDKPSQTPGAFIDGTGHGWAELGEKDFVNVNSAKETWAWRDGILYCTGQPISVLRTAKQYTNVEISFEWNHRKKGGNSGLFVWADKGKIDKMTQAGKPGLPDGIEVQILDTGFADAMKKRNPRADTSWFTSHGDVFPVRTKMTPFPPLSPNGSRSFPSEDRVKPAGNWNHYYVRAINGEVRLWVNGREVSGGSDCDPRAGYLCLESEGSPIEFRNLRLRELP